MNHTRRHYFILLLLVFMFAAPGISAYVLYYHPQWWHSTSTNRGVLLNPPLQLPMLGDDSKWRLMLWHPNACDAACVEPLDKLARVRLALGRRLYEVDIALVMEEPADALPRDVTDFLHQQQGKLTALSQQMVAHVSKQYPAPTFFIVNPDNYLVLAYPVSAASDDVFHDIKQLLTKG